MLPSKQPESHGFFILGTSLPSLSYIAPFFWLFVMVRESFDRFFCKRIFLVGAHLDPPLPPFDDGIGQDHLSSRQVFLFFGFLSFFSYGLVSPFLFSKSERSIRKLASTSPLLEDLFVFFRVS